MRDKLILTIEVSLSSIDVPVFLKNLGLLRRKMGISESAVKHLQMMLIKLLKNTIVVIEELNKEMNE